MRSRRRAAMSLRRNAAGGVRGERRKEEVESELDVFFFQAEDGIRDVAVTGVQTCALPILRGEFLAIRFLRFVVIHAGLDAIDVADAGVRLREPRVKGECALVKIEGDREIMLDRKSVV